VLAHVVIGIGLLVGVVEALETRVGHVLLVCSPRNALHVEQVGYRGDIGGNIVEIIYDNC
jgi:hypothetical protein